MIDAKELRLDNIVLITTDFFDGKKGDYAIINAQSFVALHTFGSSIYSPIELTPSILEKCGFKWETESKEHMIFNGNEIDYMCVYFGEEGLQFQIYQHIQQVNFPIKYLHQLQNWFYLITGHELEIKL